MTPGGRLRTLEQPGDQPGPGHLKGYVPCPMRPKAPARRLRHPVSPDYMNGNNGKKNSGNWTRFKLRIRFLMARGKDIVGPESDHGSGL